jgi:hypothetical protein
LLGGRDGPVAAGQYRCAFFSFLKAFLAALVGIGHQVSIRILGS